MLVAITSTKLVTLEKNGFWETMHEAAHRPADDLFAFSSSWQWARDPFPWTAGGQGVVRGSA